MSPERVTLRVFVVMVWMAWATLTRGEDGSVLSDAARSHLHTALHAMNMTVADLGFEKDQGEPEWALSGIRDLLDAPLELVPLADRAVVALAADNPSNLWAFSAGLLECSFEPGELVPEDEADVPMPWAWVHPTLSKTLTRFYLNCLRVDGLLDEAFAALSPADCEYVACSTLGEMFSAQDRESVRPLLLDIGISTGVLQRVLEEQRVLDPAPAARAYLGSVTNIEMGALLRAADMLESTVTMLRKDLTEVEAWPSKVVRFITPLGDMYIGSSHDDVYEQAALLIVDPGGHDRYVDQTGIANGLDGQRISVLLDVDGEDAYRHDGLLGAGSAVFGLSYIWDRAGRDMYESSGIGQAAALCGVSYLTDESGDDTYRAGVFAEGAGVAGVGALIDREGNDVYEVGMMGQAFSGVRGVGLLSDRGGNDRYLAGGRESDHDRHEDRYLSMAQGMSIGLRPFGGGGYAILCDYEGNDTYQAEIFGQGVSYWYSVGLLIDRSGQDSYRVHHYGQGSGIHMGLGLLADGAGDDMYTGYILAQGNGHDYGVGLLLDAGGDDTYTADQHAQGRGLNNAIGVLIDDGGDDAYFARQPDQAQGIGNDGGRREYGSLAVLADLGGHDRYSCGAQDGAWLLRPDFGIVYDVEGE